MLNPATTAEERLFLTALANLIDDDPQLAVHASDVGAMIDRDALETSVVLSGLMGKMLVRQVPPPGSPSGLPDPWTSHPLEVTKVGRHVLTQLEKG